MFVPTLCTFSCCVPVPVSLLIKVPPERVVSVHDVSNIYHVPLLLLEQSECLFWELTNFVVLCHGAIELLGITNVVRDVAPIHRLGGHSLRCSADCLFTEQTSRRFWPSVFGWD